MEHSDRHKPSVDSRNFDPVRRLGPAGHDQQHRFEVLEAITAPAGLGVVEEGAYADLIVIDGNPLEDIKVLEDYANNMKVIIRDGKVWKNTLK